MQRKGYFSLTANFSGGQTDTIALHFEGERWIKSKNAESFASGTKPTRQKLRGGDSPPISADGRYTLFANRDCLRAERQTEAVFVVAVVGVVPVAVGYAAVLRVVVPRAPTQNTGGSHNYRYIPFKDRLKLKVSALFINANIEPERFDISFSLIMPSS